MDQNIVQAMTFKVYNFQLTAGGSFRLPAAGGYFRIMTTTDAVDVTVEGVGTLPGLLAGQALKDVQFQALILRDASGAPNSGTILVASAEFQDNRLNGTVDLSATSLAALESVDLNAATQQVLTRPLLPGSSWKDTSTMVANTPLTVFTPAANVNGAIIHSADAQDITTVGFIQTFLAKASAPTGYTDGEIIAMSKYWPITGNNVQNLTLQNPTRIAAGLGLYFLSSQNGTAGYLRTCRYTLL